jgi:hypothetical protein
MDHDHNKEGHEASLFVENDGTIEWEDRISENGKPFRIGRKINAEDAAPKEATTGEKAVESKKPFDINVRWQITSFNPYPILWVPTDDPARGTAAITRYNIWDSLSAGIIYRFGLTFTCTEHYDYYFTDATGDKYQCNVFVNGDHYINYNSADPTILHIKGK